MDGDDVAVSDVATSTEDPALWKSIFPSCHLRTQQGESVGKAHLKTSKGKRDGKRRDGLKQKIRFMLKT